MCKGWAPPLYNTRMCILPEPTFLVFSLFALFVANVLFYRYMQRKQARTDNNTARKRDNSNLVESHGQHLVIEFDNATNLIHFDGFEDVLKKAVNAAGATLLEVKLHSFRTDDMNIAGFSGVAILAESHISIHTWPEDNYAALDIFMCGDSDPLKALDVLKEWFQPEHFDVLTINRSSLKFKNSKSQFTRF